MDFSENSYEHRKKLVGITLVVLLHVLLIYALLTGWGKHIINVIKEVPIQTVFIEEIKPAAIPTPSTPPTPPVPSKKVTPTKPTVPAPEVPVPQSSEAIQAVTTESPQTTAKDAAPTEPVKVPIVTRAVVDFATCTKPDYPRNSLRNEEQGTVRIQFLIGLDGHVAESKIEKSSGFRALDAAAKKALSLCRFKPGTVDGKPQQSWTMVDYVWKLPD